MTNGNKKSPIFGHCFEVGSQGYFYNAHDQELVALDPVLAAVLPHLDFCREGNIPDHILERFSSVEITEAVAEAVEAANSDGMFLQARPRLVAAATNADTTEAYSQNLQQLVLTLTEQCNLRCSYCLHGARLDWVRPHGTGRMTLPAALEATRYFLDHCSTDPVAAISFYGGEAILEWEIIEAVVREAKSHPRGKNALLVIDTNGVLLSREVIDFVSRQGLFLQVSLDGPRRMHDRQRRDRLGQGTFTRIMGALDYWFSIDPEANQRLSLVCTVTPPVDLMELDRFFGAFPPLAKNRIQAEPNLRINLANLKGQDWPAEKEDFSSLNRQIFQMREVYYQAVAAGKRETLGPVIKAMVEPNLIKAYHRSRAPLGKTFTPGGNCTPGIRKLHVTTDGRLQPCERTVDRVNLGRVESGLDVSAVKDLNTDFFETLKHGCDECWALRLCTLCYAGYAEHHRPGQKWPKSVCDSIRYSIEEDLKLLVRILELPTECRSFLDEVTLV